jgi:hypothetical protein
VSDNVHSLEMQRVLRELTTLKADVNVLRREIALMRGRCVNDVLYQLVEAFQQLPAHIDVERRKDHP